MGEESGWEGPGGRTRGEGGLRRERAEGRWDGPASRRLKVAACCSSSTSCECATRISKTSAYGTEHSAASSTSSAASPPSGAPCCFGGLPARFLALLALAPPALAPAALAPSPLALLSLSPWPSPSTSTTRGSATPAWLSPSPTLLGLLSGRLCCCAAALSSCSLSYSHTASWRTSTPNSSSESSPSPEWSYSLSTRRTSESGMITSRQGGARSKSTALSSFASSRPDSFQSYLTKARRMSAAQGSCRASCSRCSSSLSSARSDAW